MTAIGRAFVAVVPPPVVLDALEARLASVQEGNELRWMRRDQLHFTVQFLGRVKNVEMLTGDLEHAIGQHAQFDARLGGSGAFPSTRRARVVWIGVDQGADPFGALASAVHRTTERMGYDTENRAFTPHMTVARASRPIAANSVVEKIGSEPIDPQWNVSEVLLFESDTRPDGAVHTVRRRFALGGR